jgi:Fe(3+) dicitrate transport protein
MEIKKIKYVKQIVFSTYAQYEFSYKNITVNPGIRYENINLNFLNYGNNDYERLGSDLKKAKNNLSILLPGIGINYATNERLSIFASVHKGFSPPGMPSTSSTNGQAKTETALNYEIGFKFNNDFTKTQLVGFMNNYNNILGSDNVSSGGAGTGNMFNAGKATIQGIELSTEFNLMTFINKQSSYNIPLNLAYTFTNAKFNETFVNAGGDWGSGTIQKGDLIPFVTPHVIFISLGFSNKILNCTLISRFVSNTRAKVGRDNTIVPANNINYNDVNSIEKYVVFDFSTNYNFYKNFTVFATLNNIANKKYIVANLPQGYRPGMPFGINVGFKLNLL